MTPLTRRETACTLLDGQRIAAEIRAEVATEVAQLVGQGGRRPGLAVLIVGADPASRVYVGAKTRACDKAGMIGRTIELEATVSEAELEAQIDRFNDDDTVDGILIQLPLPAGLGNRRLLERIDPAKDVDGFHPYNIGQLWLGEPGFEPATPSGVIELLRRYDIALAGKHAVIVGRSAIVGKPMAGLLLRHHCTVSICHSRTRDLAEICRQADILVAAVGRTAFLGPDHVKPGAVVIDVGMNRITDPAEVERLYPGDRKRRATLARRGEVLVGDIDFTRVSAIASAITPVPRGVGPLTVAMLLVNTLRASRLRQGLK